jgi:hypothetical protein
MDDRAGGPTTGGASWWHWRWRQGGLEVSSDVGHWDLWESCKSPHQFVGCTSGHDVGLWGGPPSGLVADRSPPASLVLCGISSLGKDLVVYPLSHLPPLYIERGLLSCNLSFFSSTHQDLSQSMEHVSTELKSSIWYIMASCHVPTCSFLSFTIFYLLPFLRFMLFVQGNQFWLQGLTGCVDH